MEQTTETVTTVKPVAKKKSKKKVASKALSTVVHRPPAAQPPRTFLQVIAEAAMNPACDVAKMQVLLDMQVRIDERDAKKAFTVAFNALQARLPIINRDGKIDHSADGNSGTTRSGKRALQTKYATYPNLNRVVGPLLKKHGFTFSTSMQPDPSGTMVAISTLEHIAGHSRPTHFRITADASGGKNNQQGWGSSQQYAMRYNMIALLNIVTEAKADADNDGFDQSETVSKAQLDELINLADSADADKIKFCEVMGVDSMAAIPASRFEEAKAQLNRKLQRQKGGR